MAEQNRFITFARYVDSIRNDSKMIEILNEYMEKAHVTLDTPIEEHPFYKEHLVKFKIKWELTLPKAREWFPDNFNFIKRMEWTKKNLGLCEMDFDTETPYDVALTSKDWELLQKMIVGSAKCSHAFYVKYPDEVDIGISSPELTEEYIISRLYYYQIIQLFFFFMTEHIEQWLYSYTDEVAGLFHSLQEVKVAMFNSEKKEVLKALRGCPPDK